MIEHLEGISKFTHFKRHHFVGVDKLLPAHGFASWRAISKIDAETGKFPTWIWEWRGARQPNLGSQAKSPSVPRKQPII